MTRLQNRFLLYEIFAPARFVSGLISQTWNGATDGSAVARRVVIRSVFAWSRANSVPPLPFFTIVCLGEVSGAGAHRHEPEE